MAILDTPRRYFFNFKMLICQIFTETNSPHRCFPNLKKIRPRPKRGKVLFGSRIDVKKCERECVRVVLVCRCARRPCLHPGVEKGGKTLGLRFLVWYRETTANCIVYGHMNAQGHRALLMKHKALSLRCLSRQRRALLIQNRNRPLLIQHWALVHQIFRARDFSCFWHIDFSHFWNIGLCWWNIGLFWWNVGLFWCNSGLGSRARASSRSRLLVFLACARIPSMSYIPFAREGAVCKWCLKDATRRFACAIRTCVGLYICVCVSVLVCVIRKCG